MFKKTIIPSFRISLLVIALLLTIISALILLPKIGTEQASNENYKSEEDVKYPMDQDMEKELLDYIANNYLSPEDYVVSKFKDHDIVFVGEYHQIKHDVELISSLIPILYENGIYNLGMEFANTEDQGMIDSLINGEFYNESIAREIVFRNNVYRCFQEYVDIFKVA
ncbi:MAG TPA: ChaN family lipoprotein [archaeon]|nr:ChaN family lipoprotein [archaeon]